MTTSTSHSIKHRLTAKDVFLTPAVVARAMISAVQPIAGETWFDPFRGGGVFHDNYPSTVQKVYTEISEGRDFFKYDGEADVIISNPPYSILDSVIQKTLELSPRVFSYLLLHGAMTPKRMELIEAHGYGMTAVHTCKVFAWYGMAQAYTFTFGAPSMAKMTYDRIVHRLTAAEMTLQAELQKKEVDRQREA